MCVVANTRLDIHDALKGVHGLNVPGATFESDGFEIGVRGSKRVD